MFVQIAGLVFQHTGEVVPSESVEADHCNVWSEKWQPEEEKCVRGSQVL